MKIKDKENPNKIMATPNKRGGKRVGAGRKAKDGATDIVRVGLCILAGQKSKLARLGGSVWVRAAIKEAEDK